MKNLLNRLGRAWRGIHLADRLLLAFLAVLLIQSGHNLFARELSGESAELDVVVRTTMASIFGYFISAGARGSGGSLSSQESSQKIGFTLPEGEQTGPRLSGNGSAGNAQTPDPPSGTGKEGLGQQMTIVGLMGLAALGLLLLARNCGRSTPESLATLSQLRDFVSGSVGFLIAHGGGKGASN